MSRLDNFIPNTGSSPYNFSAIRKQQKKAIQEQGTMSIALADTLAQPKEHTLFDNIATDTKLAQMKAIDEKHLIKRDGKPTALTQIQNKIIYALSLFLSQHKEEEEFRDYVNKVNSKKKIQTAYSFPISITELTKLVSTEGKARAREKERVIEELRTLSEVMQVQTYQYQNSEGDMVRLQAPLIILKSRIEDLSPDKRLDADFVEVEFGRIFFYEIYNRFAVVKPQLFDIWGKSGSGTTTELFDILLSDLLGKYSGHRIAALQEAKKIKRSQYKEESSYFKALNKAQTNALTYSELATTIRSRVGRDYESKRSYKAAFRKDLQGAISALVRIGIIREAKYTSTPNGERIDFVFNLDYGRNDTGDSITIAQRELAALPDIGEA